MREKNDKELDRAEAFIFSLVLCSYIYSFCHVNIEMGYSHAFLLSLIHFSLYLSNFLNFSFLILLLCTHSSKLANLDGCVIGKVNGILSATKNSLI